MASPLLRTYNQLITLDSWEERLEYLRLCGHDFDSPRFMNHEIYKSSGWRKFKESMHRRDFGCDLGVLGVYIQGPMILHHINPVTIEDLENWNEEVLFNPDNVITTAYKTHNIIHYSKEKTISLPTERQQGDTKLW